MPTDTERVEWLSRELVEVKLGMMGSDGDDDVFSLVVFRGQSWHGISVPYYIRTVYHSTELDSVYAMQLNAFLFIASKTQAQ